MEDRVSPPNFQKLPAVRATADPTKETAVGVAWEWNNGKSTDRTSNGTYPSF